MQTRSLSHANPVLGLGFVPIQCVSGFCKNIRVLRLSLWTGLERPLRVEQTLSRLSSWLWRALTAFKLFGTFLLILAEDDGDLGVCVLADAVERSWSIDCGCSVGDIKVLGPSRDLVRRQQQHATRESP